MYRPGQFRLRRNVPADREDGAREGLAGYYALCTALDRNIGRLLDALERLNLVDDTIVAFTSDAVVGRSSTTAEIERDAAVWARRFATAVVDMPLRQPPLGAAPAGTDAATAVWNSMGPDSRACRYATRSASP